MEANGTSFSTVGGSASSQDAVVSVNVNLGDGRVEVGATDDHGAVVLVGDPGNVKNNEIVDAKVPSAALRVDCAVTRYKDTFDSLVTFGGSVIAVSLLVTPAQWTTVAIGVAGGLIMLRRRCQQASDSVIAAVKQVPVFCRLTGNVATRFGAAPLTTVACALELTAYPLLLCAHLFDTTLLAKLWLSCTGVALAATPWAFRYCCKARGVALTTPAARNLAWASTLAPELITLGTVAGLMAAKVFKISARVELEPLA